ncbi:MAG: 3-deoxy-7-phosphoheptulonate synthase [Spirochaetales bacterium]|nr:3-deoxy-7-phosphoheptulonate synthase [Spirochaetales bacterium]
MVIVLDRNINDKEKESIRSFLEGKGFKIREIVGEEETIFGAVGMAAVDHREVELLPGVKRVIPISSPYKLASREFRKDDTVVDLGPVKIGGRRVVVIAGPCAVESRAQILEAAELVREAGAVILRGGAYKPRTSPYAFQGLGEEGLRHLKEAGEKFGMPVVSEIVTTEHVDLLKDYVDIFQIGARNMQNFELLKKVGAMKKPVLLKRGLAATIQDLLMSAEYLLAHGAEDVILCERGIRTFETATRNTLDLSAIPVVRKLSHLPVFVDPSHATGLREKVPPMALAAVAAGAHGITVEVHPDPEKALSDGAQSLYPEQFRKLMRDIEAMAPVIEKEMARLPSIAKPRAAAAGKKTGRAAAARAAAAIVAFQGERGSFSEKAIALYFHEEVEPLAVPEFRDIFEAVLAGRARYGMVPVENSLSGSIHQNYDLLLQFPDTAIVGEKKIRIVHNLIGTKDSAIEDVRRVYSHPQGLAQCEKFLEAYPAWEKISYYDTAGSAAHVAEAGLKENAAIASEEAAAIYGLKILKPGVETNPQNYTRFVIIARTGGKGGGELKAEEANRVSIVFATLDKPGALFFALEVLARRSLNMTKLESRPIPGKPWEYMFYLDLALPPDRAAFAEALEELKKHTEDLRVLGIYKA